MHELTEMANKYDIDKGTRFAEAHGYTETYGSMFESLKNEPITILEIGVWHGDSIKLWEEYFPNAKIIGIDNDSTCSQYNSNRSEIYIGFQQDTVFLKQLAYMEHPFDIIIDDGSHRTYDIDISFATLYPFLRPNGLYFIEDLHAAPDLQTRFKNMPEVTLTNNDKLAMIRGKGGRCGKTLTHIDK